jgi:hypothetical protein
MIFTLAAVLFFPLATPHNENTILPALSKDFTWWNLDWPYRKLITIDHTKVITDLQNFPVLISLPSDPDIAMAAQTYGQDIVFVQYTDNSTVLNHEIECYNHSTGLLIAWVNVTMVSATSDTKLWMYYGNPFCIDQQNVEGTWDAHYVYVHHLNERNSTVYDSTQYHNDGTCHGSINRSAPGKIDGAFYFNGTAGNNYVDTSNSSSLYNAMNNAFTVETWSKTNLFGVWRSMVTKDKEGASKTSEFWFGWTDFNKLDFKFNAGSDRTGNTTITDTNWHYLVGIFDGTYMRLYLDGNPDNAKINVPKVIPSNGSVNLGVTKYWGNHYFSGTLDEVRISDIARSSGWISTTFQNQNNPTTFISVGLQEAYEYTLNLTVDPLAGGTIETVPVPPYHYNDVVTVTALATPGYTFEEWGGDLTGSTNPAEIIMTADHTVIAYFTENEYSLTLIVDPLGGGIINVSQSPPYHYNDVITVTAVANPRYIFDHWAGDLTGNENPTMLVINGDTTVSAMFLLINTPPIAMNDSATLVENSSAIPIDVLANDHDPDGDTLTITSTTQPEHGAVSQNGVYVYYTPAPFYIGEDMFTYTINDGYGGEASACVFITVLPLNHPPYTPSNPSPGYGATNVSLTANLTWTGGDPDPDDIVSYDVYFGTTPDPGLMSSNQSTESYNPGILVYATTYYWQIVSWDSHHASSKGKLWYFTTQHQHEESITVNITSPLDHSFYLRNRRLFSLPRSTIIYGPITITATVTSDAAVDHVEFYIDGKLKKTETVSPYEYRWSPFHCLRHEIMVRAYDINGHISSAELWVFKWRIHPLILIAGMALYLSAVNSTPQLPEKMMR